MARFKPDSRLDRLFKSDTWLGRRLDRHVHWGLLRRLGNSRLVTSSWLWLFVVPVGAKVLSPFAGEHDLTVPWLPDGRNVVHVDIGLPFSWKVFYLMSWAFIIGQSIYWLTCPRIVQWYGSYGEYVNKKGENRLAFWQMMRSTLQKGSLNDDERAALSRLLSPRGQETTRPKRPFDQFAEKFHSALVNDHINVPDAFDVLLRIEERGTFWGFCVAGLAFLLGLFLFGYVVVENLVAVCRLL